MSDLNEENMENCRLDIVRFFLRANEIAREKGYVLKNLGYLTQKRREEILAECTDKNIMTAKKYFQRDHLFFDTNTDIPRFEMQDTKLEQQLAKIFVPVLCETILELRRLKNQLGILKNQGGGEEKKADTICQCLPRSNNIRKV